MSETHTYLLSRDLHPGVAPDDVAAETTYFGADDQDTDHGTKPAEAPGDRCGFVTDPPDLEGEAAYQSCCYRETWGDSEYCVWHAPPDTEPVAATTDSQFSTHLPAEGKPVAELERVRETPENRELNRDDSHHGHYGAPAELLDGALVARTELDELSDLTGWFVRGADLRACTATEITLSECDFRGSDLSGSTLRRCDIGYSVFDEATFIEADLTGTKFRGAYIRDADLSGADLSALGSGETADMSGSRFSGIQAEGLSMQRVDLNGAEFEGATLDGARIDCTLDEATFEHASMEGAEIGWTARGATFERANLTEAVLTGLDAEGASFEKAILNRADLSRTTLVDARFRGAVTAEMQIDEETQFFPDWERRSLRQYVPLLSESDPRYCVYDPRNPRHDDRTDVGATANLPPVEPSYSDATSMYRQIEVLGRNSSRPTLQSTAFVRRQEAQTQQYRLEGKRWSRYYNRLSGVLFRYGDSIWRVFGWSILLVLLFAVIYPLGGFLQRTAGADTSAAPITWGRIVSGEPLLIWDSLYYSALTFTSLGFVGYEPVGFGGQLLTVLETGSGAVLIALFVFVLGRRATQ